MDQETTVLEELKLIKKKLDKIEAFMPDKDMFLDIEEKKLLEESYRNENAGKLTSGDGVRKLFGI